MPRDLLWVMAAGDKDGGGTLSKFEIRRILIKFRPYLRQQGGLASLITKYDPEGKGILSDHSLRLLLQDVTGAPADMISAEDLARVRQAGGDRQETSGSEGGGKQVHLDAMASAIDQVFIFWRPTSNALRISSFRCGKRVRTITIRSALLPHV